MKSRSLAGNCGIGVFVIALVTVALAFGTPSWLVSDSRIRSARLDRLGLWSHCFRSLSDPLDQYQRRFFVGCRWVYDPFTTGYDRIRGYLLPGFMIATQFFFTLCLLGVLVSTILVLIFFLCCGPDQSRFIVLIKSIGYIMLGADATLIGASITYIAGLFLLLSFAGPYWIESYPEMFSSFKHMGLWEYCFDRFRFPSYQFDKLFHGCHYVFSQEYYVIREWLLPGWLMSVQAFVTLALILSFTAQVFLAFVIVRWPLRPVLRYEWIFVTASCIMVVLSSAFLFLAVAIFGGNCYRRDWLLYPSFNVLSWSYAFAVIAFMLFGAAGILLYLESRKLFELRLEARNLVSQMQHNKPEHALHQLREQLTAAAATGQLQQQRGIGFNM